MEHKYGLGEGNSGGGGRSVAASCYDDQRKVCGYVLKASHQFVAIIVMGDFAIVVQANQMTGSIFIFAGHSKRGYEGPAGALYE
jgi:hypothetical protein